MILLSLKLVLFTQAVASQSGKISLVQYNADSHFNDYAFNRYALTEFVNRAAVQGSNIIVLPEGSLYGYADSKTGQHWCLKTNSSPHCLSVEQIAEKIPFGPSTQYFESLSKEKNIWILFNLPEMDQNHFYNTTAIVSPDGFVAKYRKRALYVTDQDYATAGNSPTLIQTPWGRFGIMICMDIEEGRAAEYKSLGANAVLFPTDWDQDPNGTAGARPARTYFAQKAKTEKIDIFASDVSNWDGTGKYFSTGGVRERNGLNPIAINQNGMSTHLIKY